MINKASRSQVRKCLPLTTWQVKGAMQAVAPVQPWPPHWPYSATVPAGDDGADEGAEVGAEPGVVGALCRQKSA